MESLNRIELAGIVGTARMHRIGESNMVQFSVATNYAYKEADGTPVIETTWHYVIAFEGKNMPDLNKIQKGANVHLVGRLRNRRYTDANGNERESHDIIANKIELIHEE